MPNPLSPRERLQACLADDPALDRPPVALWRHFPVDDQAPETLAAAVLHFQTSFQFDLVKLTPASSYCLKDWGATDAWAGDAEGTRRYGPPVIATPADWERLAVLDPDAPHLAAELACLGQLRRALGPDVPLVQTLFSPLAQAKNLAGPSALLGHMREHPEALLTGLVTLAETARRFAAACVESGVDGLFLAAQHHQPGLLTRAECETFGLAFDLRALEPAAELWCNVLHLHGNGVYFDLASAYNMPIVNWHDREGGPALAEARQQVGAVLCGGISRQTLVYGDPAAVAAEAAEALTQTGGRRFILGTGCVAPIISPYGNLMAVRRAVERG